MGGSAEGTARLAGWWKPLTSDLSMSLLGQIRLRRGWALMPQWPTHLGMGSGREPPRKDY